LIQPKSTHNMRRSILKPRKNDQVYLQESKVSTLQVQNLLKDFTIL
jgi:hypothetical protein